MGETVSYDRYPAWIVAVCVVFGLATYALGAYVLAGLGWFIAVAYLAYCLWVEGRVLRGSCVDCVYYGRVCAFGKGALCARLFKRGDPHAFAAREVDWTAVLPDLLVIVLPLVGGIVRLVRDFSWVVLGALLILLALATVGNGLVRGGLACRHCKQGEYGCPAAKLFGAGE